MYQNHTVLPFPTDLSHLSPNPSLTTSTGITVPQIIRIGDDGITIRGLTPEPSDIVRNSGIMRLAHRLKKLWFDGDRLGAAGFMQKKACGCLIENPDFSLSMAYTHRWTANHDFVVSFIQNGAHTPCWVDDNRQTITKMADHEVDYFTNLGISLFAEEVTHYFQEVLRDYIEKYKNPRNPKSAPNYLRAPAPALQPYTRPAFSRNI